MKRTTIHLDEETGRQIKDLAKRWGLPQQRNLSPVISRCVERVWLAEFGNELEDQKDKTTENP